MRTDPARLATLKRVLLLDAPSEILYDKFTQLLAENLDVPIAMLNLLDVDRDLFKSCIGLSMTESSAATSFCETFFNTEADLVVADDTLTDARFANHPFVSSSPYIRFYAGARLVVDGQTIGTLCAYDLKPKKLSFEQLDNMRLLAGAVVEALRSRLDSQLDALQQGTATANARP